MSSAQLEVAVQAALKAGKIINQSADRVDELDVREKSKFDFVSNVDTSCQEVICEMIQRYFPKDGIEAEESEKTINPKSRNRWIIDPLDGTTNFLHRFPQYAVSIAYAIDGKVMAGVVYDPVKGEMFTAERGKGAFLNKKRIRVSGRIDFSRALIGTGFPFRSTDNYERFMPKFEAVAKAAAGLRRAGSAALDLAYVACGRLDGFWEYGLKSWDMAAGTLLVLEAGGLVTDMEGKEAFLATGNVCCGTPKIFAPLLMKAGDIKGPVS